MDVADFSFNLPDELIAQEPSERRDEARLMVLSREQGRIAHSKVRSLAEYLRPGDLLVLNNTKVFPARLLGMRVPSGGAVECLLIRQIPTPDGGSPESVNWEALVHPGQKLKEGAQLLFERHGMRLHGEILGRHFFGRRTVRIWTEDGSGVTDLIPRIGHIPLPPYIKREDRPSDHERYQTVYARESGSIAAPTAGLHFTPALLDELASRGVERTEITLHVGYGTFKPIRASRVEDHAVDAESYAVSAAAAAALSRARSEGRRVLAVGTTTVRALESLRSSPAGDVEAVAGETDLFVRPGYEFQLVDGLMTNFHLPQSSLLVLVAAFAGRERILAAYREAVAQRYRFYSYGDAMLIV